MPKTTYSQRSLTNREASYDLQSVRKTKRKSKIHKKQHKKQHPKSKLRSNKIGSKGPTVLRYKSAYSPQYIIQIHDIQLSSFDSDSVELACHLSEHQVECQKIQTIPLVKLPTRENYQGCSEDYEKRDLERIMEACRVTDDVEGQMADD